MSGCVQFNIVQVDSEGEFVHAKCWQKSWIAPLPSRYLTTFKPSSLTKFLTPTIDVWVLILIKPLYPALPPEGYRNLRAEESNYRLAREGRGRGGGGGVGERLHLLFFSKLVTPSGPYAPYHFCSMQNIKTKILHLSWTSMPTAL